MVIRSLIRSVPETLPLTERTPTSISASTSPVSPTTSSFSEQSFPVTFPSTLRMSGKRISPLMTVPSARKPLMSSGPALASLILLSPPGAARAGESPKSQWLRVTSRLNSRSSSSSE